MNRQLNEYKTHRGEISKTVYYRQVHTDERSFVPQKYFNALAYNCSFGNDTIQIDGNVVKQE